MAVHALSPSAQGSARFEFRHHLPLAHVTGPRRWPEGVLDTAATNVQVRIRIRESLPAMLEVKMHAVLHSGSIEYPVLTSQQRSGNICL